MGPQIFFLETWADRPLGLDGPTWVSFQYQQISEPLDLRSISSSRWMQASAVPQSQSHTIRQQPSPSHLESSREPGGGGGGGGDESEEEVDPERGGTRSGGAAAAAIMSLRPFSRLLTRSFKINRSKVESSPGIVSQGASMLVAGSGRPARSLHTIRDVGAGDSTYGAVAAAAAAALTGGAGILIFKKRPDDDDGDVTMEDMKVDINKEEDMWKHPMDVDLEARFDKWIEEMGREYPNEEEKAFRFELFKKSQKGVFRDYEGKEKVPLPNRFGDMTDDEIKAMLRRCHPPRSKEYEASEMRYHQIMKKKMDEVMLLIEKEKREGMSSTAQSSNAVSGHD